MEPIYPTPRNQLEPSYEDHLLNSTPDVSEETIRVLEEANKSLLASVYQKDFNDHGDLRIKTMLNEEILETFENLELRVSPLNKSITHIGLPAC